MLHWILNSRIGDYALGIPFHRFPSLSKATFFSPMVNPGKSAIHRYFGNLQRSIGWLASAWLRALQCYHHFSSIFQHYCKPKPTLNMPYIELENYIQSFQEIWLSVLIYQATQTIQTSPSSSNSSAIHVASPFEASCWWQLPRGASWAVSIAEVEYIVK